MSGMLGVVSYGLGTLIGFGLLAFLVIVFIQDITQKKHTVLRNYPVIGHCAISSRSKASTSGSISS